MLFFLLGFLHIRVDSQQHHLKLDQELLDLKKNTNNSQKYLVFLHISIITHKSSNLYEVAISANQKISMTYN